MSNKQDPVALRQFLKDHLDSKYADVAIQNLNEAMANSSNAVASNARSKGYDFSRRWRVTAQYKATSGKAAYCV